MSIFYFPNFRGAEPRLYPHRSRPLATPPELRERRAAAAAAAAGAPGSPRPAPAAAGQVIPLMGWSNPGQIIIELIKRLLVARTCVSLSLQSNIFIGSKMKEKLSKIDNIRVSCLMKSNCKQHHL